MSDLMTDADVAARLGIGEKWVADAAKARRIPCLQFGRKRRYREEHLEAILAAVEQQPIPAGPRRSRKSSAASSTSDAGVVRLERKTPPRLRKSQP